MSNQTINADTVMFNIAGYNINLFVVIIGMFFVFLAMAFWKAHRSRSLDFRDMITRDGRKVSTTKILQLLGGVVGTWVIVKVTIQGQINWDLYMIYLAYVAGVDGFSKLVTAKYSSGQGSNSNSGNYGGRYGGSSYHNDEDQYTPPRRTTSRHRAVETDEDEGENLVRGGAKAE